VIDVDTAAVRASALVLGDTADARTINALCFALDEAREVRRQLRRRLVAAQARLEQAAGLPRFPDDDDPNMRYVVASDLDAALWGPM
jgi:hypothetical protein